MPFLAPIGIALGATAASAATVGTIATVAAVGAVAAGVGGALQAGSAKKAAKSQNAQIAALQAQTTGQQPSQTDANAVAAQTMAQRRQAYTQTLLTNPQGISGQPSTGKTLLG